MNEFIEKVDNFKNNLDELKTIKDLLEVEKEISNNIELKNKIVEYKKTWNEKNKIEIVNDSLMQRYRRLENEVNFLILEINDELKTITQKGEL